MIGETLGHYEVLEKIGSGGMGEVFRARDTKLNRDVALKILPAEMAHNPERLGRFEREAQAIAALKHVNIVTIHAVEQIDDVHFLVMELVAGDSLATLMPSRGFDLERFLTLAIPLTEAIHQAHAKGITHRDLKPANVMIDADGTLKVLDFGLAKLLESEASEDEATTAFQNNATQEGLVLGTVAYMSPEQAEGKLADHRSDIFSMGILFYEMLTGERPFKGDTRISTISSILREEPTSVTMLQHNLPRHLGRIIKRCLAKDPERRYQTALDLRNELLTLKEEIDSGELRVESFGSSPVRREASKGTIPWRWIGASIAVVAVAFVAYTLGSGGAPSTDTLLSSHRLTSQAGVEGSGSWSPDGGFVAYSHSASGPTDIFVMSSSGGEPIHLVESEGDDVTPRWSPDNRWIAFISNRLGSIDIYLVPPLGGVPKKLVETGYHGLSMGFMLLGATPWSMDGRTLLFSRRDPSGATAIWSIDLGTGTEAQLTHPEPGERDFQAAWSPDGSQIAFVRDTANDNGLFLIPSNGGEPYPLPVDSDDIDSPSWSPDGKHLVFGTVRDGKYDLWSIALASKRTRRLTSGTLDSESPVVASDGRILYNDSSHQTDLYVQNLETGDDRRVTSNTQDNFEARLSPDDQWVAYMSTRTGNAEIWLLHLGSGEERQLTDHPSRDSTPDWSPDGRRIAFLSDRSGTRRLYVVDVDGGVPRAVGERQASDPVHWTPDGSAIGFLSRSDEDLALWVADPETGESQRLLDGVGDFDWYVDATRVVYKPRGAATSELRIAHLETGETVTLMDEPHIEIVAKRDGSAISYCSARSHFNMNLHVLHLEAPATPGGLPRPMGAPEQMTHGDGRWHVHNGDWSSDGARIVYTRDTDTGDVHVLEGAF